MLEKVLRDVASWCWPYSAAKPFCVRVDVDRLACPLHHPMACNRQMRGHDFMSGTALSHHTVVGGGAFWGMRSPQAWILAGVVTVWTPMDASLGHGALGSGRFSLTW
jgi:hypothetical protein